MELTIHVKQNLSLSPRQLQSMRILQMNCTELTEYIEACALENPMLEMEYQHGGTAAEAEFERLDIHNNSVNPLNADENDYFSTVFARLSAKDTLADHLFSQLRMAEADREITLLCAYLIAQLDENGYLEESAQAIAAQLDKDLHKVVSALELLQSFEPAGVGAQNATECLLLQLRRRPGTQLEQAIVKNHMKELGLEQFNRIAKSRQVSLHEVRKAYAVIRSLSLYPGSAFSGPQQTQYILPELLVKENNGELMLCEVNESFPTIKISNYYQKLMDSSEDPEVIRYLRSKHEQVEELIRNIEQRRQTIHSCAEVIFEIQKEFFCGRSTLRPMTQEQIAVRLGVHKSTVSRAIRGKYIKCDRGTFLLSDLFSRAIKCDSGFVSPDQARRAIQMLIRGEDPAFPLSDQKLADRLAEQGISISRRTVAKYRDEMHIVSSSYRKHNEK